MGSGIYQYLAVFSMNLLSVSYGMAISWSSSSVLILKSRDTPMNDGVPMTDSQISWIASLLGLGGLFGTLVGGFLCDTIGRKKTLLASVLPQMASWLLIIAATDATLLYVSRFLAGLSAGALFIVIPIYTAEISEDRIRGKLGSLLALSINLGILLGFISGHYLSFYTVPKYAIWFSVVCVATAIFFPESPLYLLRKGKLDGAVLALQFYRNSRRLSQQKTVFFKSELDNLLATREEKADYSDDKITWKDFQSKSTRQALLIGYMNVFLNAFCGVFVMTNYAASIFAEAGTYIAPNVSAIFVGLLQFMGTYCSLFLVDRIGRKPLLAISSIGTGLSLLTFGTFTYVTTLGYNTNEYGWIPIVSFCSMLFIAACGIMPLLMVIISEFMPDKLRTIGATSCTSVSWFIAFVSVFCFPSIISAIGLHGCIFLFSGCCFVGAAFAIFYMPETKGKSFNEIFRELEK